VAKEEKQDKSSTVIINSRDFEVTQKELTFEQVVNLRYNDNPPTGEFIVITVTYSRGEDGKQGSMVAGGPSVKVKDGMVFNVTATDKS
jgi:hypothetical protein